MKKSIILIGTLMLMLASCSNENILLDEEVKNNVEPALTIIASQGVANSRLAFVDEKNLEWTPGDAIIVTEETSPSHYITLTLQENEQTATGTFTTTNETSDEELNQIAAWRDSNTPLMAYYKNDGLIDNSYNDELIFERFYDAGHGGLSVLNVYGGQTSNNNKDHLKAFNHMASKESFTLSDDTPVLNLKFSQSGAIMKLTLTGLGDKTIKKLSLNAAENIFLAGYHKSQSIRASSVSLPLGESGNGITLGSDETLTAYMIMGPTEATADKTITLTATASDESTYTATITGGVIEAGKFYSVSKTMTNVTMGDKTATQAVKGDYAMADGTFISKDATLTDEQKANVRGIVFWTTANMNPDPNAQTPARLTDDKIMAEDFPYCTHGLIVSLKNVDANMCNWQTSVTSIASWQENNFNDADKNDYKSIASTWDSSDFKFDLINYILGYQNTKILKAYNNQCADANKVLPVSLLETWEANNPAPANTTGWFIPSEKELTLLWGVDSDNVFESRFGTSTMEAMNGILASLGTEYANNLGSYYWSSSELAGNDNYAFVVSFNSVLVFGDYKLYSNYVRAVCAY